MKRITIILLLLLFGCGGGDDASPSDTPIPVYVFMGDSITAGDFVLPEECYVNLIAQKAEANVINQGIPGELSSGGMTRIDEVLKKYKPDIVGIYYGTNDIGFYSTESIINNIKQMVMIAKSNHTVPIVFTLGPFLGNWAWRKPYAVELNVEIRKLAYQEGIKCVDLELAMDWQEDLMVMPDGEHPNKEGHKVIAEEFLKVL